MKGDAQVLRHEACLQHSLRLLHTFLSLCGFSLKCVESLSELDEMLSVMRQFFNGLVNIGQRCVLLLFFEAVEHLRLPALGKFFEGADIQIAIVQIGFQLGHELDQKSAVLADGIATQGGVIFGHELLNEGQNLLFCILLRRGRSFDFVNQTTAAMRALVPSVHFAEQLVALMDDAHRAFNAGAEVGASDDHRNFQQALFFGVEACHFAVNPNQVVVCFTQCDGNAVC